MHQESIKPSDGKGEGQGEARVSPSLRRRLFARLDAAVERAFPTRDFAEQETDFGPEQKRAYHQQALKQTEELRAHYRGLLRQHDRQRTLCRVFVGLATFLLSACLAATLATLPWWLGLVSLALIIAGLISALHLHRHH